MVLFGEIQCNSNDAVILMLTIIFHLSEVNSIIGALNESSSNESTQNKFQFSVCFITLVATIS